MRAICILFALIDSLAHSAALYEPVNIKNIIIFALQFKVLNNND